MQRFILSDNTINAVINTDQREILVQKRDINIGDDIVLTHPQNHVEYDARVADVWYPSGERHDDMMCIIIELESDNAA